MNILKYLKYKITQEPFLTYIVCSISGGVIIMIVSMLFHNTLSYLLLFGGFVFGFNWLIISTIVNAIGTVLEDYREWKDREKESVSQ